MSEKKENKPTHKNGKKVRTNSKRTRSGTVLQRGIEEVKNLDSNEKMCLFTKEILMLPDCEKYNVEQYDERLKEYVEICQKYSMPVSNKNMYMALGLTDDDVYNILHGRVRSGEHCYEFITKAQQICSAYRELLMATGSIPPAVGIFWQKNYDGMKDETETVVRAERIEEANPDTLRERYLVEDTASKKSE